MQSFTFYVSHSSFISCFLFSYILEVIQLSLPWNLTLLFQLCSNYLLPSFPFFGIDWSCFYSYAWLDIYYSQVWVPLCNVSREITAWRRRSMQDFEMRNGEKFSREEWLSWEENIQREPSLFLRHQVTQCRTNIVRNCVWWNIRRVAFVMVLAFLTYEEKVIP